MVLAPSSLRRVPSTGPADFSPGVTTDGHPSPGRAYAVRRLFKSPGFALMAILTLALGIGANSAIFSVVNGVLLQPLPYDKPDRLVGLFQVWEAEPTVMSPPNFLSLQSENDALEDASAIQRIGYTLTGVGEPVRVEGAAVSSGFFNVLRSQPVLGRAFRSDENEPGKHHVVVLGHGLWQQRFGADPRIVGKAVTLDAEAVHGRWCDAGRFLVSGQARLLDAARVRRELSAGQSRRLVSDRGRPVEAGGNH